MIVRRFVPDTWKRPLVVVTLTFLLVLVVGVGYAWPQQAPSPPPPPPKALTASPDQAKDLKLAQDQAAIAQKDVQLAQQSYQVAQQIFQAKLAALNTAGEKVIADNKWPAGTQFNPDTLTFAEAPPPPTPGAVPASPTKPAVKK